MKGSSRQWLEQDFPHWFGNSADKVNIVATFNLTYNSAVMVRTGIGYAVTYDKLTDVSETSELTFRPLIGVPKSQMYIIWRKLLLFKSKNGKIVVAKILSKIV